MQDALSLSKKTEYACEGCLWDRRNRLVPHHRGRKFQFTRRDAMPAQREYSQRQRYRCQAECTGVEQLGSSAVCDPIFIYESQDLTLRTMLSDGVAIVGQTLAGGFERYRLFSTVRNESLHWARFVLERYHSTAMKIAYRLRDNAKHIAQVQKATLTTDDFGIEPTDGLFASAEWWNRIASGELTVHTLRGTITEQFMAHYTLPPDVVRPPAAPALRMACSRRS
jgi:hypothetical protein